MKTRLYIVVLFALMPGISAFSQKAENRAYQKAYDHLYQVYIGHDEKGKALREDVIEAYVMESKLVLSDSAFILKSRKYPITVFLLQHMLAAVGKRLPDVVSAREALQKATSEYVFLDNADNVSNERKRTIIDEYSKQFGLIVPADMDAFYKSNFCRRYNIVKQVVSAPIPEPTPDSVKSKPILTRDTIRSTTPTTVAPQKVSGESGMTYTIYPDDSTIITSQDGRILSTGKTPQLAVQKAMDKGRFSTKYMGAFPVKLGQEGWIKKDEHGTFYNILLFGAITADTLHFEKSAYTQNNQVDGSERARWGEYNKAIQEMALLLGDFIDDFGPEAYEFYIIGNSDSLRFIKSKPLDPAPYNSERYRNIVFINHYVEDGVFHYYLDTLHVGTMIDNNEELHAERSMFIKEALEYEPVFSKYPDRIKIVKGHVVQDKGEAFRNTTIILYINWDVVHKRLSGQSLPDYSPIKTGAKP